MRVVTQTGTAATVTTSLPPVLVGDVSGDGRKDVVFHRIRAGVDVLNVASSTTALAWSIGGLHYDVVLAELSPAPGLEIIAGGSDFASLHIYRGVDGAVMGTRTGSQRFRYHFVAVDSDGDGVDEVMAHWDLGGAWMWEVTGTTSVVTIVESSNNFPLRMHASGLAISRTGAVTHYLGVGRAFAPIASPR